MPECSFLALYFHTVTIASSSCKHWYSSGLSRSYCFGCSDGGREGTVETTRYPTDFDAYIVGDPFFDISGQILAGRAARFVYRKRGHATVRPKRYHYGVTSAGALKKQPSLKVLLLGAF
jgi:hypothetical protein